MTVSGNIKQMRVFILAVSCAVYGFADDFTATVVKVRDGDSLVVLHDEQQVEVRLEGIDCPELHQAFGQKAKQATFSLVGGKIVTVQPTGTDQYNRILATVILPDGRNLNQELVRKGYAWWFRKYSKNERLGKLEAEARQKRLGLWADPNPTPPWDWRKAAEEKPAVGEVDLNGVAITGLLPDPVGKDEGHEAVEIGNGTGKPVDLAGWRLRDRAENEYRLTGTVAAEGRLRIVMTKPTMPLNNDGDTVLLIDSTGAVRSGVEYTVEQVRRGTWVEVGR